MNKSTTNGSSCPYYIVIDLRKIPAATLQNWITNNSAYFAGSGTRTEQKIDTTLIPKNDFAQWLFDNQNYISYDQSYSSIECAHHLTDSNLIKIVNKTPEVCRMSLANLITELETAGCDYATPSYMNYAALSFINNEIHVNAQTPYSETANCYSMPFLKSISKVNPAVIADTDIIFKSCAFPGETAAKVILSVATGVSIVKHYDFSQIPP